MLMIDKNKIQHALDTFSKQRKMLSIILDMMTIALLISALLETIFVMISAYRGGYLRIDEWMNWNMNHGPWWYSILYPPSPLNLLHESLEHSFELLIMSVKTSFLSMLSRFTRKRLVLLLLSISSFMVSVMFLGWLID